MNNSLKKLMTASMLAAICCVATMVIKIPSPLNGYINLGDCIVIFAGFLLSPAYAFASAAVGSALADILSGYIIYAPATFIIKGFMALIVHFIFSALYKRTGKTKARIISGFAAELFMIAGYFVFEGFLYGFVPSAVNIPANAIQGVAGIILGVILTKIFEKTVVKK